MSCGVGHGGGSELALLRLWSQPEHKTQIQPLTWELKKKERKKVKERKEVKERNSQRK